MPFVILASKDNEGPPKVEIFKNLNSMTAIRCGTFTLSTFLGKLGENVYRLHGPYGYCSGGTAAFQYDSLIELTSTGLKLLDEIDIGLH